METDGQTEMTKLIVDFGNVANAPKNTLAQKMTAYRLFMKLPVT